MLTSLRIRNFKMFEDVRIELGRRVVFIGPNNGGKSTALQALALWETGLRKWNEKRKGSGAPEKRPGVTINRRDLVALPIPNANLLWRDLHVRKVISQRETRVTQNIRVDIIVSGITSGKSWDCGLEFDYANDESFYCRPLKLRENEGAPQIMTIPEEAARYRMAYLPPMSGLAAVEPKWEWGRVNVLLGEGQTAQVLRNLCLEVYEKDEDHVVWNQLADHMKDMFGAEPLPPEYIAERGEIVMAYKDHRGPVLDISAAGRGMQQTLLLLAYLYNNPQSVLLLDEPDAHLEILRQRQIYELLSQTAEESGSQLIAASHSEVLLESAARQDVVIAFVGKSPHRMNDGKRSEVLQSLREYGYAHYYQVEQTGWVLYVEGETDLAILKTFAETLDHPAAECLARPFVQYTANQPSEARRHFNALREAKKDLVGLALFDRLEKELNAKSPLVERMWRKREIENYFCKRGVLMAYAGQMPKVETLWAAAEKEMRLSAMQKAMDKTVEALHTLGKPDPWSDDIKASDDFLVPLFNNFSDNLDLPNQARLTEADFHQLARLVPKEEIDPEIVEKLDAIVEVAQSARPA